MLSTTRSLALLVTGLLALSGASVRAQAAFPFEGTTAVGQSSAPLIVTVTMTGSGVATAPQVLMQGIAGLDFSLAPGGTCAANVSYTAGQQCTVNVIFAPKYPGLRNGAVVLVSTAGNLIGSTLLTGEATGSLAVLVPGEMNTVAGNSAWIYAGDGVAATDASIFLPTAVVTDAAGNLYLSDSSNNRVRRVDAHTGLISTVAGNGTPGYSGDRGLATQAMISSPAGLALDGAGNLYFADTGNHAVRRIDAISGIITTVAGLGGVQGYSGDGASATSAKLSLPEGIAFDAAQDLFIADTGNNVIREVNAVTGVISTVAGTGVAGYNGDVIPALAARLDSPWNVSVAADNSLYIADMGNNRIRKVSPLGIMSTVAGTGGDTAQGDGGSALAADLNAPASIILDPAGNLYIADSGNNRVREVTATSGIINTIAGTGGEQFIGDGGPANLASLYGPYGLFLDQTGNLFLTDMFHNRVREISATTLSLQYATLRVGKVSPPQVEGLVNDGNATLTLLSPALNNAALDPATTTCNTGSTLTSAATCNLGVEFAPTTLGTLVLGSVLANSNAGNSPATLNLSGQVLSVNPTTTSLTSSLNPSFLNAAVTFTATIDSGGASPTGPVTFLDGTVQLCSVNLNANSIATCTTSTLALGQHSITASYAGDTSDASSVSPALTQVVKQPATIALVASPNPAVVTASVTLTATATAATGTPTGAITFYDAATAIGSANLNASGVATFSTTLLSAATHSLSAQYAGDATNAAAQSNIVSEVIQQATTLTTIGSSNASATVGTAVTFTASVISTNGPTPTGTVAFSDGATALGSGTLNGSGIATLLLSTLTPGTHHIVATYSGDASNATSASTGLIETIQQIATVTVLTSSLNPAGAGAAVQLTAKVSMAAGYTADGTITGQVTFSNGANPLSSATVDANGNAVLSLSTLPAGLNTIVATYTGTTNYASSTSVSLTEHITATATTTTLVSSAPNGLAGETTTFTATAASSTGIPTGTVNFLDGSNNVGSATLNAQGVATLSLSTLSVGSQTMVAAYAGDGNYLPSSSGPVSENISLGTPGLTLTGPGAPVNPGINVNLTGVVASNGVAPTGALTLHDGVTAIATQNVLPTGSYAFSTSTLAVGTHTLTVAYAGDANNAAAASNPLIVIVQQAPTTTSLATSINPQVVGQNVTLTSTVTSVSPNLTGSISFQDGATLLGSVSLNASGTAVFTTSSLVFGSHNLTAVYSGDTNHAISTSPGVSEQIVQSASAALTSSVTPSNAGASVVFTAKLAGVGSLVPTGSVTFTDGVTTLGVVALDVTGAASFQTTSLAVGSHSIVVAYPGDKNYSSASATLIQTVVSANTQIALTASANPAIYGTPLALAATITSNGGIATGSVTFTDGGTAIGTAVLNATGVATLTTSTLAPGTHTLVAVYAGDGSASASSSTPLTLVVKELTSVALASSANPAQTLAPIVLTAVVSNSGVGVATGSVTFTDGSTQLGTATLDLTGTATLTVPSLTAGNHSLLASYAGDAGDFAAVSPNLTQGIQLRPTTTTLTASNTDPNNPLQVTLIAVERWTGSTVSPTGTVSFMNGANSIGSTAVDATGVATLTIVLQSATDIITASYSGDASYTSSKSSAVTITGGQATQFTMQLNPSTLTMPSGQHNTVSLTIASVQGFADTLQLGCLGLPTSATCTFSSDTTALAANGTATVQVTIDTGNPLGAGAEASVATTKSNVMLCFLPVGLLAGIALFRKRRRALLGLLLLIIGITATLGTTGCAGLTVNSTPAGTYSFKVTANGQQTGATQSQTMTLIVTQ